MTRPGTKYLQIAAYVMLAFIFVFVIGIARDCSHLQTVTKEGFSGGDTIDIAVLYAPGGYYLYEDTIAGINHDIIENFSRETNEIFKIWPVTEPADVLTKLESGAFDIIASLPLDNNIKKKFPVSESIFLDKLVLIQLTDSTSGKTLVNSSLDLNGKKVYVAAGSSAVGRLENLSNEIGGKIDIEELPEVSDELLSIQVASGTLPLAVVNERIAKKIKEKYPDLQFENSVSFTQFQVWVFNDKDTLILNKFNTWFDLYRTTDSYRSILNKY